MNKVFIYIILISLFSLTILSCAKKSSDESSSSTTELEGAWASSCGVTSWDNSHYVIKTWTFTGSALVVKWDEYSDSSCATDWAIWTDTYSSFSIGNEATLDNGSTGRKFTMKVDSFVVSMQTAAAVTAYNGWSWCGYSDFALNTTKDYTGKTCGGNDYAYAAANTNIYGVYLLEGSSLLMSNILSSSSPYQDNVSSVDSMVLTKQ
jgi:hypothetical protein